MERGGLHLEGGTVGKADASSRWTGEGPGSGRRACHRGFEHECRHEQSFQPPPSPQPMCSGRLPMALLCPWLERLWASLLELFSVQVELVCS